MDIQKDGFAKNQNWNSIFYWILLLLPLDTGGVVALVLLILMPILMVMVIVMQRIGMEVVVTTMVQRFKK